MTEKEAVPEVKKEEVKKSVEEIEKAVEAQIKQEKGASTSQPVAIVLKGSEIKKRLEDIVDIAEDGVERTERGLVIIYQRTSKFGEMISNLFFFLLGLSIFLTGVIATPTDLFALGKIVTQLAEGLVGRLIVIILGLGLLSFGAGKALVPIFKRFLKKRPKYIQKQLASK